MKGGSIIYSKISIRLFIQIVFLLVPVLYLKYHHVIAVNQSVTINEQIDQLLNQNPYLNGAIEGVSIRSATTGEIIYERNGNTRLKPASNLKLLTAAGALSALGKDYQFRTEIVTDGTVTEGILNGNLYMKGYGDPTLQKSDIDKLIKDLQQLGIKEIQGNLIGDDTWFDDNRYSIDLPWSDETTYYGAQISALTLSPDHDYDAGTIIVEVRPGKVIGQSPMVKLIPQTEYIQIINLAKTVKSEEKKDITISREHGTNQVVIEGTIPKNGTLKKEWIAVWDPTMYVMQVAKESMSENKIHFKGDLQKGTTPVNSKVLASHLSKPLSDLLFPFLKLSNNGHGEILVKEMGRVKGKEGSWEKGLPILETELANLGVQTSNFLLRDGSGVSHVNLITSNEMTKLLFNIQEKDWFSTYLNSLPAAGSSDRMIAGTLLNRLSNLPMGAEVQAKTGTLTTVSSLSGYLTSKNGESYIFSIIINNLLDESDGKKIEDQLVTIIANY